LVELILKAVRQYTDRRRVLLYVERRLKPPIQMQDGSVVRAPERLEHLRSPEGESIPPNTLAELCREIARKQLAGEQIRQIENARLKQLNEAPKAEPNLMVIVLMRHAANGLWRSGNARRQRGQRLWSPAPLHERLAVMFASRCSRLEPYSG
jgi:hypothetical protein